ncbi:MAG: hypothetical protein JXB26_01310 [Candidatus Aminicenantes bacterium]|nr:hypothetical protein [Candidatus Aminicenantes bacterium]
MKKNRDNFLNIIDRFAGRPITVWGDFILDEYIFGTTRRISREAPVLILSYEANQFVLGGAANSVRNLKSLGAVPLPVGVIGKDEAGKQILKLLKKENITTIHIRCEQTYRTPIKTRILAGEATTKKQQILRIDREESVPNARELKTDLQKSLMELRKKTEALLISDYNYGTVRRDVFDKVISAFKKDGLIVSLDSRFRLLDFPGITVCTPNEPEVETSLHTFLKNEKILHACGREILKKTEADAVLLTRGGQGMQLYERKKTPFSIPIYGTTDIVDVTGAGDSVISVFTLAVASGASYREAALLANYAGGIVVMKKGTATVTSDELKEAVTFGN